MRNRGLTLIEMMVVIAILAILALIVFGGEAKADQPDHRVPVWTTGVTVGPFHGGNSWPHTGTGIHIPLRHKDRTVGNNEAAFFMDWKTLQVHRAHSAASQVLQSVRFEFDSSEIAQHHETDLDFAARILSENPEVRLHLAGHTDLVGSDEYNEDLALRRAEAIKAALVERGVSADRLEVTGHGEKSPVDLITGKSPLNRRVEVVPILDLP